MSTSRTFLIDASGQAGGRARLACGATGRNEPPRLLPRFSFNQSDSGHVWREQPVYINHTEFKQANIALTDVREEPDCH